MTSASAPGKIILLGEHAVVYGRPAIAAPVWDVQATATISAAAPGQGCSVHAPDLGETWQLATADEQQPLIHVLRLALTHLSLPPNPDWRIEMRSTIPIASGLGSGAALSAALVRAISAHVGQPVPAASVSELVFASERFYHGTPSGIDNTVIAHGVPIWFVKEQPPQPFTPGADLTLLIADSGIPAPTKLTVGDVRRGWLADPTRYEAWFDQIAALATAARQAIETGALSELGRLFTENQQILQALGVSSPALARLIGAARAAGALGAKLSGGGRGGNMIALVTPGTAATVAQALHASGAKSVLQTTIPHQ